MMAKKIKRDKIKLNPEELRKKSVKVLEEMKKTLEIHIMRARRNKKHDKLVNIKEEKRNIARINTIIKEKKSGIIFKFKSGDYEPTKEELGIQEKNS